MSPNLRIVIIGGVAGGASAATRARRINESAEIILLEKDEHVSFANCGLPYYIGGEIPERKSLLVATAQLLQKRFRIDVRTRHEAIRIDRAARIVEVQNHLTGNRERISYDRLILSPGARPIVPTELGQLPANVVTLRNLADTDRIVERLQQQQAKSAVVVGGGFIGLEMVEQLVHRGCQVSIIERNPHLLPLLDGEMAEPLAQSLESRGVKVVLNDGMKSLSYGGNSLANGIITSAGQLVSGELIILGLGVVPNVELAVDAGLEIGTTGGIRVNQFLQTSDPSIYAVGDAVEYDYIPTGRPQRVALAGPANRAGRLAGEHAASGRCTPVSPVCGTAIVRVFEMTAGLTGLSERLAARCGITMHSVYVVANHHAGYFPGASPLTIKLSYDPETGRVLGAQVFGREGVDKRLDVVATLMAFQGTVRDLAGLDLAYAPPFGSAKDPLHMAAFAACNQLDGLEEFISPNDDLTGLQVIDVRTEAEVTKGPLANCSWSKNIPLDELRSRLSEIDGSKPVVVSCGVGLRGHNALRILKQSGVSHVRNLSGGATLRKLAVAAKTRSNK